MNIHELMSQHPDVYIEALHHGAYYAMNGYSNLNTMDAVAAASLAIEAAEREHMYDFKDDESIHELGGEQ